MKPIYWILIAGLFILILAMERVQKEKTGARIASLLEDIEFKEAKNQYLRYQIHIFKAPEAVIKAAKENGLEVAPPQDIIVLEEPPDVFKKQN